MILDSNDYTAEEMAFIKETTQKVFLNDHFRKNDLLTAAYEAYVEARKGKRGTEDEQKFEFNLTANMANLVESIERRIYKPSRGIAFIITKPVIREIFAAPFRDRVVHHLLYDLSYEWWDRRFIGSSFSCRENKGTICGYKKIQQDMRACSKMGKIPTLVCKFDIQGYFMSLRRSLLYERIEWGLNQQFKDTPRMRDLTKYLWREIIFDDPVDGVKQRGLPSDWDRLPFKKSLIMQPDGVGIVIGNLTSQLLSNIFMDQFDRFVSYVLGYQYYGRYVDDFYIIIRADDFPKLEEDLEKIERHLKSLGLTLHPKKRYIQPVEKGVDFLGAKVMLEHIQPGPRIKHNFNKTVHNIASGLSGDFDLLTSYDGLMSHMQSGKYIRKVYESVGWEYEGVN